MEVVDLSQAPNLSGGIVVRIPQELDVVVLFLGISMSWLFVLWKNALESQFRDLFVSVSRHRGASVSESWCRGFLVLESRCRGFLVMESRCRGICASTALLLLSSWNQKKKKNVDYVDEKYFNCENLCNIYLHNVCISKLE